jgi:hypothetical protein
VAAYYLSRKSWRAAEARLRGLLLSYPETHAAAATLYTFGQAYTEREEPEGASLAYATLVRLHPDDVLAKDARTHLPAETEGAATDPLPHLLAYLDTASTRPDRTSVPKTVSAYPDRGNASGARY